jgi:hypothetical protein
MTPAKYEQLLNDLQAAYDATEGINPGEADNILGAQGRIVEAVKKAGYWYTWHGPDNKWSVQYRQTPGGWQA